MNARGFFKAALVFGSIGLSGIAGLAQPIPAPPPAAAPPVSTTISTQPVRSTVDSKDPLVVRIDPARVLDSSGQSLGKIENIVLSPSGCADAVVITGERGRLIPVPWQMVKISGETRAADQVPGSGLTFTVNASNERIIQAPSFARDQWPNVSSVSWLEPSVAYFKSGTSAAGGTASESSTSSGVGISTTVTNYPVPPVAITNNPNANLASPRSQGPNIVPVPPSIPPPVNPGPATTIPPVTQPPASVPAPVTPPPSTSVPPNTQAPTVVPSPGEPKSPSAGF